VCLWFLTRDKTLKVSSEISHQDKQDRPTNKDEGEPGKPLGSGGRDRRGETLFIDARKMGTLVDRVHRI
jgi:type I restriction enzyme M protein